MTNTATHLVQTSAPSDVPADVAVARNFCVAGHFARNLEIRGAMVHYVQTEGIDGEDIGPRSFPVEFLVAVQALDPVVTGSRYIL